MASSHTSVSADSDATAKMKPATAQQGTDALKSSFLQALTLTEEKSEGEGEQCGLYVNPLLRCSSSFLSDWNVETCTESLGSETGSDFSDGEALLVSPGGGNGIHCPAVQPARKKLSLCGLFLPPLTSVSAGVQLRSCREGGRLVVEAAVVPSHPSFFHVDRSHGRVRVRSLEEEEEKEEEVEAESEELEKEEEEKV